MKFSSFVVAAMVVLSLGGCLINRELTKMHVLDARVGGVFEEVCSPEDNPAFDCHAVMKTKWAVWPPTEPDADGRQDGTPLALIGWWYFTGVGLWCLLIGRCERARRAWHTLFLTVVWCGFGGSLFYSFIMFFGDLPAKCMWCIVSHAINLLLLVGAILLWPRKSRDAAAADSPMHTPDWGALDAGASGLEPAAAQADRAHPSVRLVVATVIAILSSCYAELWLTGAKATARREKQHAAMVGQLQKIVDDYYHDTEALLAQFESEDAVKITLRPDDPRRGEGELLLPLVVFSDFQCPACRDFAEKLDERLIPAFDGLVQVYWKHLPWCTDCNPHSARSIHPYACQAAFAAEAARLQGGSEAFWKTHDILFAHQRELGQTDYPALAKEIGLNPERFVSDMASDAVKQRVTEDIAQAHELGVKSTPTIFLWNRPVDRRTLMNPGFVKEIVERFKPVRNHQLAQQRWEKLDPKQRAALLKASEEKARAERAQDGEHASGSASDAGADTPP